MDYFDKDAAAAGTVMFGPLGSVLGHTSRPDSEHLSFSKGQASIGEKQYELNKTLKYIDMQGSSIKSVGAGAFMACDNLLTVSFSDKIEYIGDYAFFDCKSLTGILFPDFVKDLKIEGLAFSSCQNLRTVQFPSGTSYIGNMAFAHCDSLSYIKIPETVKEIGATPFASCKHLHLISAPKHLQQQVQIVLHTLQLKGLPSHPAYVSPPIQRHTIPYLAENSQGQRAELSIC